MELSKFGRKFAGESGIVELMDDLGSALLENPEMIMMGGGNPGQVPQAEAVFRRCLESVMADPERRDVAATIEAVNRQPGLRQAPDGSVP